MEKKREENVMLGISKWLTSLLAWFDSLLALLGRNHRETPEDACYKGWFLEEFKPGGKIDSPTFSTSRGEMRFFGKLTWDRNPIHTDGRWCKEQGLFGCEVVHGMLTLSRVVGMADRLGFLRGTCLALQTLNCDFLRPVEPDQEVFAHFEVLEKGELRKFSPKAGVVTFLFQVKDCKTDKVAVEGRLAAVVMKKK